MGNCDADVLMLCFSFLSSENRFGGCRVDKNTEDSLLFTRCGRSLCMGPPPTHICFPALGRPAKGNISEQKGPTLE